MKNNEKGFIAISIIYSVFILFVMLLLAIMFSYMSDRKSSNRIKEDIKNQFTIGSPIITYSQNGSDTANSSYNVRITVTAGRFQIGSIKYVWSTTPGDVTNPTNSVANGNSVTLSNASTTAGNYYLITKACDVHDNCSTLVSKKFILN